MLESACDLCDPSQSGRKAFRDQELANCMSHEILSVAIYEPLQGLEAQSVATMRELFAALSAGGYSRDSLHKDANTATYVLIRHWASEAMRRAALEDPVVLRCWAKLANEIRIVKVYETLDEVAP